MKQKLTALRRQVAKLAATAPPAGQGKDWLALWRLDDLVAVVEEVLVEQAGAAPISQSRECALIFVAEAEACRLGFMTAPEFVAARNGLVAAMERFENTPCCGAGAAAWAEYGATDRALSEASGRLAGVILSAWGFDGPMGPRPPGIRPPREDVVIPPEWFREPDSVQEEVN